jgi:hypothetical protein
VVLQVAPDAGQVGVDRDAEAPQLLLARDAGEREQPGRLDGAGADDHLVGVQPLQASVANDLDAGAAVAVEQEPDGARVGQHVEQR